MRGGFFLRAESLFNVATEVERLGVGGYGERSLHEQSHGESFLSLVQESVRGRQLVRARRARGGTVADAPARVARVMKQLVDAGSQFVIATHSPILLAYPSARIYALDGGLAPIAYDEIEHVRTPATS